MKSSRGTVFFAALLLVLVRPDAPGATDPEIDRLLKKLPPPEKLVQFDERVLRANDPAFHLSMELARGDIQFINNHTVLHARTAYEDHPEPERMRHLLRLWLVTPAGRPLPHWHYERYGAGRRGGIYVPGVTEMVSLEPIKLDPE